MWNCPQFDKWNLLWNTIKKLPLLQQNISKYGYFINPVSLAWNYIEKYVQCSQQKNVWANAGSIRFQAPTRLSYINLFNIGYVFFDRDSWWLNLNLRSFIVIVWDSFTVSKSVMIYFLNDSWVLIYLFIFLWQRRSM